MITLNKLTKITKKGKKRLGRGHGSQRGKTAGRGTKGQKARGKVSQTIAGSYLATVKRLPLFRGKLRNKPHGARPLVINVKYLNVFKAHEVVDKESLITHNIVKRADILDFSIKILGDGELKVALIVKLPCSKGARKKILAQGGKIETETIKENTKEIKPNNPVVGKKEKPKKLSKP